MDCILIYLRVFEVLSLFGRFLIEIIESYRRIIKFIQKKNDVNL